MRESLKPVVARLRQAILDNHLSTESDAGSGPEAGGTLHPAEASRLAAEVVMELTRDPEAFPRLVQRRGLLFVVEDGAPGGQGQPDLLHVCAWYGNCWISVERIILPGHHHT